MPLRKAVEGIPSTSKSKTKTKTKKKTASRTSTAVPIGDRNGTTPPKSTPIIKQKSGKALNYAGTEMTASSNRGGGGGTANEQVQTTKTPPSTDTGGICDIQKNSAASGSKSESKATTVDHGSYDLDDGPPWQSSRDRFLAAALAKAAAKKKLQLNETEEDGILECDNTGISIATSFSVPPMQEEEEKCLAHADAASPATKSDKLTVRSFGASEFDLSESKTDGVEIPPSEEEEPSSGHTGKCPFHINLEQLETGEKVTAESSEIVDVDQPRHSVGCTPHECHGAMMDKSGFSAVGDPYSQPLETKIAEATAFLRQFAVETSHLATPEDLQGRIADVTNDISAYGTYRHTHEELEFGCRLAWRNSGRCIMRKVSFNLELRDCRSVKTSQECYDQIVEHLHYAGNGGAIKPVISIFPQKGDGISAPVRVWNRQLIGYAAYQRKDGSVMGDPVNLSLTALSVKLGWTPPSTKSDFDILPLIISDNIVGHDRPRVFDIPADAILEVPIHHPEHELFSTLNLRWYALPAISNMGVDIGGVYYQTCPFNGWYQVTEIGRDFLDKQRYDLAEAVAIACGIQRSKIGVWRDDVQLQIHKAILHSFAKASVSLVDHHTASDSFIDFHREEIGKRGRCPADWVWVTPPAGGSMTRVFHQEMVNFIVKPIYRPNVDKCFEAGLAKIGLIVLDDECKSKSSFSIDAKAVVYDKIVLCFGSETGTSQRFITRLSTDLDALGDTVVGPIALDDLPNHFPTPRCKDRTLILVAASTTGIGIAPSHAKLFLPRLENMLGQSGTLTTTSFSVLSLGNSAYTQSFAKFGFDVHAALDSIGFKPVLNVRIADELMDQELAFNDWKSDLLDVSTGIIYQKDVGALASTMVNSSDTALDRKVTLSYQGFAQVIQSDTKNELEQLYSQFEHTPWSRVQGLLGRSIDLFCFEVDPAQSSQLKDLRPGDHVALYPRNLDDSVDLTLRMINGADQSMREVRDSLKEDVDLARPVSTASLAELFNATTNEKAKYVIGSILRSCTKHNTEKSVTDLINELPPGSIPYHWMLTSAPTMDPRFYSIASISHEERTVSICQSVYAFPNGQAGTTSRWLRSLQADEQATAVFSQTDLHLPEDEDAPCIMIATGTGIAPFRSFWMSSARNPMHLFFGCRTHSDLPFASEIGFLERAGRINPFIAYSREMSNKMYVQDMLASESEIVLSLLHNPKTHLYICGSPDMAATVQNRLLMTLCNGSHTQRGMNMNQAMQKLVVMKQQKRFITEVYGAISTSDDAIQFAWKEATARVVEITSGLERLVLPKARAKEEFKAIRPTKRSSWAEQFKPECSQEISEDNAVSIGAISSDINADDAVSTSGSGKKQAAPVTNTGMRIAKAGSSQMIVRSRSLSSIAEETERAVEKVQGSRSTNSSPSPVIPSQTRLHRRESWMGSFTFGPEGDSASDDLRRTYHGRENSRRGSLDSMMRPR